MDVTVHFPASRSELRVNDIRVDHVADKRSEDGLSADGNQIFCISRPKHVCDARLGDKVIKGFDRGNVIGDREEKFLKVDDDAWV